MAVHFSGPVLHAGKGSRLWFEDLPVSSTPDYTVFFDDFDNVAVNITNDYTQVKDTGAAVAYVANGEGGELAITSAATTDNDGGSIQGNSIFKAAADRTIWFETRLRCNDADQTDICVGLTVSFATNPENILTATDRIVFQVNDDNASILCKTELGGVETSTDSGVDLADNVYARLGIQVVGLGTVRFFVNRKLVATHTTNIPTVNLRVAAMSLSGSATGTRATTLDYLFAAQTR